MIIIYTSDNTIIKDSADSAKEDLISVYGPKLGIEAYEAVNNKPAGAYFQKFAGPLVKIVDKEEANLIKEKEISIGMM